MKRYFTFETPPANYHPNAMYHYMSLPGSGYICVIFESDADVPADWVELPHLLEARAANFNGINTTPGDYVHPLTAQTPAPAARAGILVTDSMFQIAKKLATENKLFRP
jgi:hypothetical protein